MRAAIYKPSDHTLNTQEITRSWSASVTTLLTTAISDWDWDGQSIPLYSGDANIVELTAVSERLWEQVNFSCSQSHSTTLYVASNINGCRLVKWSVLRDVQPSLRCRLAAEPTPRRRCWGDGAVWLNALQWWYHAPISSWSLTLMMSLILPHVALLLWLRGRDKVLDRTCCARLRFSTQLLSTMMQKWPYTAL